MIGGCSPSGQPFDAHPRYSRNPNRASGSGLVPAVGDPLDEGNSTASARSSARLSLDGLRVAKALGVDEGSHFFIKGRGDWTKGRGKRPSPVAWQSALAGRYALATAGHATTRVTILDFDVGHGVDSRRLPPVPVPTRGLGLDAYVSATRRGDSKAARMRAHVAQRVRPGLERLRAAGVPFLVQSTPRGCHAIVLLPRAMTVLAAREIGLRMRALLCKALCPETEVFPTPDGRMCALAGPGRRLLADDAQRLAHRWRRDDIRALLALAPLEDANIPAAEANLLAGSPCDVERTCDAPGQLRGRAFADELVLHYEAGIPAGASWDAARRWSFALVVGLGLSVADAEIAWSRLLVREGHGARHCRGESGRRELLRTFRACVKRHSRAVANGDLQPGRMRDARMHRIVDNLLGRPSERERRRGRAEHARLAAVARWSRPSPRGMIPACRSPADSVAELQHARPSTGLSSTSRGMSSALTRPILRAIGMPQNVWGFSSHRPERARWSKTANSSFGAQWPNLLAPHGDRPARRNYPELPTDCTFSAVERCGDQCAVVNRQDGKLWRVGQHVVIGGNARSSLAHGPRHADEPHHPQQDEIEGEVVPPPLKAIIGRSHTGFRHRPLAAIQPQGNLYRSDHRDNDPQPHRFGRDVEGQSKKEQHGPDGRRVGRSIPINSTKDLYAAFEREERERSEQHAVHDDVFGIDRYKLRRNVEESGSSSLEEERSGVAKGGHASEEDCLGYPGRRAGHNRASDQDIAAASKLAVPRARKRAKPAQVADPSTIRAAKIPPLHASSAAQWTCASGHRDRDLKEFAGLAELGQSVASRLATLPPDAEERHGDRTIEG
jgi:hypothetical protein